MILTFRGLREGRGEGVAGMGVGGGGGVVEVGSGLVLVCPSVNGVLQVCCCLFVLMISNI